MSRRTRVRCDRCFAEGDEDTLQRDKWTRVYAATIAGVELIGTSEAPADLCDPCAVDLRKWINTNPEDR
jgi:hypothetical protein